MKLNIIPESTLAEISQWQSIAAKEHNQYIKDLHEEEREYDEDFYQDSSEYVFSTPNYSDEHDRYLNSLVWRNKLDIDESKTYNLHHSYVDYDSSSPYDRTDVEKLLIKGDEAWDYIFEQAMDDDYSYNHHIDIEFVSNETIQAEIDRLTLLLTK